jgi:TolB-like protein
MRDSAKIVSFGDYALDLGRGELLREEKPVDIQPTPLRLLLYLAVHRDRVVSRQELLDAVWPGVVVGDEALTTALAEARHAVGDDGAAQRVIRTRKGRGYRFVAEVGVAGGETSGGPKEAEQARRRRSRALLALAASVLGAVAAVAWIRRTPPPPETLRFGVAVLPVVDLTDGERDRALADGLTAQITHALAAKGLPVVARTTAQWRERADDVRAIGASLGVSHVVEGSVRRDGERLRVTMQLVATRTGTHEWSEVFEHTEADLFALQDRVTARVGDQVYPFVWDVVPKGEVAPEVQRVIEDVNAASRARHRNQWKESVLHAERALAEMPKREPYLRGRADMLALISIDWANLYTWQSTPFIEAGPKLLAAAERGVAEAPDAPYARTALARAYMHHWRWSDAEREMRASCDLAPRDPIFCGANIAHVCPALGCVEEQLEAARLYGSKIGAADALGFWMPWALINNDRLEDAEAMSLRAREIDSGWAPFLPSVQWRLGRHEEVLARIQKQLADSGDAAASREIARRSAESPAAAMRWIAEQQAAGRLLVFPNQRHFLAAQTYAEARDLGSALAELERSVATHEPGMELFGVDPIFDPIRDTPRFRALIEQMGLTAYHEKYGVFERARQRVALTAAGDSAPVAQREASAAR